LLADGELAAYFTFAIGPIQGVKMAETGKNSDPDFGIAEQVGMGKMAHSGEWALARIARPAGCPLAAMTRLIRIGDRFADPATFGKAGLPFDGLCADGYVLAAGNTTHERALAHAALSRSPASCRFRFLIGCDACQAGSTAKPPQCVRWVEMPGFTGAWDGP